ncbi:GGDEF domain-containing protein [Actinoplanes sp. LDG1-06]|uniref:GGDEF domain-containing protein n=1 Tax=Paractinoplanes ovalisporus TaxID=2810368 RepID=A0ABS2AFJ1_9ACTN|nr:GGDEF domain-containing protein [Actinoplanes ovalisporus]MBM2618580.1 GGDEF domain-containing protein [Actinoplanes ovalisporus]
MGIAGGVPKLVAPESGPAYLSYFAVFALIQVWVWRSVREAAGRARLAHAAIAGGLSTWFTGDIAYELVSRAYPDMDVVWPAEILWVAGYPLLVGGLLLMVRLRAPGRMREAALDVLAMTTVVASLFWQFYVAPQLAGEHGAVNVALMVFYPFGDVLLFVAGALLALAPGVWSGPTRYLLSALIAWFVADMVASSTALWAPDFDGAHLDAVYLVANCLVAAALCHRDASRLSEPHPRHARRLHPARMVFLGIALLALPAVSAARTGESAAARFTTLGTMVVLTVIVLIRFMLMVRTTEQARAAVAHQAAHDQLTGLVNRPELLVRLSAALRERDARPVVHFLDLNGFKAVNDVYGHAAGDAVLAGVAERLRAAVREPDTVARLGGDEFVVLSEATDDDAAFTDRLRHAVEQPTFFDGHELRVGVSIGVVAAADLDEPTAESLLATADAGMYREKALAA